MYDARYPWLDLGVRVVSNDSPLRGVVLRYDRGAGCPWVVRWDLEIGNVPCRVQFHRGDELFAASIGEVVPDEIVNFVAHGETFPVQIIAVLSDSVAVVEAVPVADSRGRLVVPFFGEAPLMLTACARRATDVLPAAPAVMRALGDFR